MTQLSQHIACVLKSLRKERGWSLDKTAQETGVSKAMLGQIEREESSPTIATLWKIASGFHTSFSSFIEEVENTKEEPIYRTGVAENLSPTEDKIRILTLFPFDPQLSCEIFMLELLPESQLLSLAHEPGVIEHIIVIKGTLDILINQQWNSLKEGEALRFNADKPHGYRNTSSQTARFHNIIHYQRHKD